MGSSSSSPASSSSSSSSDGSSCSTSSCQREAPQIRTSTAPPSAQPSGAPAGGPPRRDTTSVPAGARIASAPPGAARQPAPAAPTATTASRTTSAAATPASRVSARPPTPPPTRPRSGTAAEAAKAARQRPGVKECTVCAAEHPLRNFRPLHQGATHGDDVCLECAQRHVRTEVTGDHKNVNTQVLCCVGTCRVALQESDFVRLDVPGDVRERLQLNQTREFLRTDPDAKWCAHPNCGNCVLHFGDGNVLHCDACKRRTCVHHNVVFHDGLTCAEYDQRERERSGEAQAANLQLIQRVCKVCPKCRQAIEKNEGCDHMRCRCGHEFCWRCLADYNRIRREGNTAHERTCHYYA